MAALDAAIQESSQLSALSSQLSALSSQLSALSSQLSALSSQRRQSLMDGRVKPGHDNRSSRAGGLADMGEEQHQGGRRHPIDAGGLR